MGTERRRGLPKPAGPRRGPAAAGLGGTGGNRRGRHNQRRAQHRGRVARRGGGTPTGAWQYQPVDQAEQQRLAQQRQDVYRFRDQRQQAEANAAVVPATGPAQPGEPDRRQFAPSPIVAKSADQLDKVHTPPQPHAPPPLDNVVQPTPRPARSPEQPQQRTVNRLPLDTAPQPRPHSRSNRRRNPSKAGGFKARRTVQR